MRLKKFKLFENSSELVESNEDIKNEIIKNIISDALDDISMDVNDYFRIYTKEEYLNDKKRDGHFAALYQRAKNARVIIKVYDPNSESFGLDYDDGNLEDVIKYNKIKTEILESIDDAIKRCYLKSYFIGANGKWIVVY